MLRSYTITGAVGRPHSPPREGQRAAAIKHVLLVETDVAKTARLASFFGSYAVRG
jgi:hypothetical protein